MCHAIVEDDTRPWPCGCFVVRWAKGPWHPGTQSRQSSYVQHRPSPASNFTCQPICRGRCLPIESIVAPSSCYGPQNVYKRADSARDFDPAKSRAVRFLRRTTGFALAAGGHRPWLFPYADSPLRALIDPGAASEATVAVPILQGGKTILFGCREPIVVLLQ